MYTLYALQRYLVSSTTGMTIKITFTFNVLITWRYLSVLSEVHGQIRKEPTKTLHLGREGMLILVLFFDTRKDHFCLFTTCLKL